MRAILMIIAGIVGKQPHEVKIVIEKLDVPRISMYLVVNPRGETVPSEFVSQYIERMSRDAVEKYQPLFKRYVRHRQGGKHYALISNAVFWYALTAIFTGIASVGIILASRQLRFQAWLKAQDIWTASDFTQSRGLSLPAWTTRNETGRQRKKTDGLQVCRKIDEFAGLIPYLPKRIALRLWGVPVRKGLVCA